MAECECLPKCPFFHDKMENMPGMSALLKKNYCLGESLKCARHRVFLVAGKEAVPADLFPNQTERIDEIISESHRA